LRRGHAAGGGATVIAERVVVPLRMWAESPCDRDGCIHPEGLVVDRGGERLVYICWCGTEVEVLRDDEEIVAAMAALTNGARPRPKASNPTNKGATT
jgi:hypothetical protein